MAVWCCLLLLNAVSCHFMPFHVLSHRLWLLCATTCRLMVSCAASCCLMLPHALLYVLSQTFFCCLMPFDAVLSCPLQFYNVSCCFVSALCYFVLPQAALCYLITSHSVLCCLLLSYAALWFFFLLNFTLFPVNVFMFGAV